MQTQPPRDFFPRLRDTAAKADKGTKELRKSTDEKCEELTKTIDSTNNLLQEQKTILTKFQGALDKLAEQQAENARVMAAILARMDDREAERKREADQRQQYEQQQQHQQQQQQQHPTAATATS